MQLRGGFCPHQLQASTLASGHLAGKLSTGTLGPNSSYWDFGASPSWGSCAHYSSIHISHGCPLPPSPGHQGQLGTRHKLSISSITSLLSSFPASSPHLQTRPGRSLFSPIFFPPQHCRQTHLPIALSYIQAILCSKTFKASLVHTFRCPWGPGWGTNEQSSS